MSLTRFKIGIAVLAVAALVAACDGPRDVQVETQMVALQGATRGEVGVHMGAGELRLRGGDQEALLEASFEFNRERLRPAIEYRRFGDKGILHVRHSRRNVIPFGRVHNRWDLNLSKAVPLDLTVELGAGQSDLDLRGLKLERVEIDMGVGEVNIDLQGPREQGFRMKIDGGVGSAKLRLPSEVGVRVKVDGGLGSVNAHGMTKQAGAYVNDAYGKTSISIEVDVNAGIGSLELRCEPAIKI